MWRFGNSNWSPTLQEQLDRAAQRSSGTVNEFPSAQTACTETSQALFRSSAPTLVFNTVEETRINQRS